MFMAAAGEIVTGVPGNTDGWKLTMSPAPTALARLTAPARLQSAAEAVQAVRDALLLVVSTVNVAAAALPARTK
jgi:hypothetical protein